MQNNIYKKITYTKCHYFLVNLNNECCLKNILVVVKLLLNSLLKFSQQFVNWFTRSKRKKSLMSIINNKHTFWDQICIVLELQNIRVKITEAKKGSERKIEGRKERGNFSREIPSFVPSAVCIPPLLAALSNRGCFFLLHFARARSFTFILLCSDFVLMIYSYSNLNRKRKLWDSCVIFAY